MNQNTTKRGRMPQSEDDIGYTARDIITGWQGIINYRVAFLTGCNQYGLLKTEEASKDEKIEKQFDEHRLEIIEDIPKIILNSAESTKEEVKELPKPGGPNTFVSKEQ